MPPGLEEEEEEEGGSRSAHGQRGFIGLILRIYSRLKSLTRGFHLMQVQSYTRCAYFRRWMERWTLIICNKEIISIFSISHCDLCFGILDSQPRRQGENGFLNSVSYSESAVQEKPQRVGSLAKLNLKRNYLKQNRKKVIIHWSSILEAATSEKRYEFC